MLRRSMLASLGQHPQIRTIVNVALAGLTVAISMANPNLKDGLEARVSC